jgi:hypothetical protein
LVELNGLLLRGVRMIGPQIDHLLVVDEKD